MREDWYVVPAQYAMRLVAVDRRAQSLEQGQERLAVLHERPRRRLPRRAQGVAAPEPRLHPNT